MNRAKYFESEAANELWEEYLNEVDQYLSSVPYEHATSISNELASHAFEAVRNQTTGSELEKLEIALKKLGAPKDIVPPMITEAAARNKRKADSLKPGLQSLLIQVVHSLITGLRSIAVLFSALFCLTLFVIACMKPIMPNNVGLFTKPGDEGLLNFSFGLIGQTEQMQEHLGLGFIPVALFLSFIFFKLCVLLLKNPN